MRIVAVPTELARLRHAIRVGHPALGSSHLAEAFARGLGFGTNAAFLAWDRQRPRSEVPVRDFDLEAASNRLGDFGHAFDAIKLETAIDFRAGRAEGMDLNTAAASGMDAARHRRMPESYDGRQGYAAHLMLRRANSGGGIKAFIDDAVRGEGYHRGLAASIRDAATIDPPIAGFLADTLKDAGSPMSSWKIPAGRLWWRDLTFAAYVTRIRAFFEAMCLRSPLAFRLAVLNDAISDAPELRRPTEPVEPSLTLDMGPSDSAGLFDTGRSIADPDTLVGAACMAMWRAGYLDEVIQSFADEARMDPAIVLASRFGVCRENVEALKSFLVHPLDGMTDGEPPETVGIVLLRDDQCAYARSRAERSEWKVRRATPSDVEAEMQGGSPSYPDLMWVDADNLGEHEMRVISAAALRTTVMVTGIGPDDWERLRLIAGAGTVKAVAAFDASVAPGPRMPRRESGARVLTLAEMQGAIPPAARDLLDTVRHYAESGGVVSPGIVASIIRRIELDAEDMEHLQESCSIGRDRQASLRHHRDVAAYDQLFSVVLMRKLEMARSTSSVRPSP